MNKRYKTTHIQLEKFKPKGGGVGFGRKRKLDCHTCYCDVRSNLAIHLSDTTTHFTFLVKMALDCISNYTGLAYHNLHRSFITNFIFIAFLLLCTIPIQVLVVTICDRLHFYKCFNVVFEKLYSIFQMTYGLYQVSRQCHQLHMPERQLKKTT